MASRESVTWDSDDLLSEVSAFLRAADEPETLTFKQVRLAVEKSLDLPEGDLNNKSAKSKIKTIVHSVMDEIEREADAGNGEPEEQDEERSEDSDDGDDIKTTSNNNKRGRNRATSSSERQSNSAARRRKHTVSDSDPDSVHNLDDEEDASDNDSDEKNGKKKRGSGGKPRGQKAAVAPRVTKKRKGEGAKKAGYGLDGEENEDATLVCVLSQTKLNRRQVNVQKWKGRVQVNIREYYLRSETQGVATKAKSFAPSFKGTTLDPNQWNVLKNAARDVDEMISQMT